MLKPIILRRDKNTKYEDGSKIISLPPAVRDDCYIEMKANEKKIYNMLFNKTEEVFHFLNKNGELKKNSQNMFIIILKLRYFIKFFFIILIY